MFRPSAEEFARETAPFLAAADYINSLPDILPNHNLDLWWIQVDEAQMFVSGGVFEALKCAGYDIHPSENFTTRHEPKNLAIGPSYSDFSTRFQTVSAELGIPQISFDGTADTLTAFEYFNRLVPSTVIEGRALAELVKYFGWSRVGMISQQGAYHDSMVREFQNQMAANNITIGAHAFLYEDTLTPERTEDQDEKLRNDLAVQVAILKDAGANIIIAFLRNPTVFFEELRRQGIGGYPTVVIGGSIWALTEYLPDAEGFLRTQSPYISPETFTDTGRPEYAYLMNYLKENSITIRDGKDDEQRRDITQDDITEHDFLMFDTVILGAYALDEWHKQHAGCDENPDHSQHCAQLVGDEADAQTRRTVLNSLIREVRPVGLTGLIELDENGDRKTASGFVNYIDDEGTIETFAYLLPDGKVVELEGVDVVWRGGETDTPKDRIEALEVLQKNSPEIFSGIIILCALSWAHMICYIIYYIIHRNVKIIKMSSVPLNMLSIFGCIVCLVAVIIWGIDENTVDITQMDSVCNARLFIIFTFTIVFGPLFAKTYRIYKLFSFTFDSELKNLSMLNLVFNIAVLLVIDLLVVVIWLAASPLQYKHVIISEIPDEQHPQIINKTLQGVCFCDQPAFMWVIVVIKGALLAFGGWLSYNVRNVAYKALNDSRTVGFAIYSVVITLAMLFPVSLALDDNEVKFAFLAIVTIFLTNAVAALISLPKILAIRRGKGEEYTTRSTSPTSVSGKRKLRSSTSGVHTSDCKNIQTSGSKSELSDSVERV